MQFLGPALKGMKAYWWRLSTLSTRNLSGSNFSGSGYISGSLCVANGDINTPHPAGMVYFPATRPRFKVSIFRTNWNNCYLRSSLLYFYTDVEGGSYCPNVGKCLTELYGVTDHSYRCADIIFSNQKVNINTHTHTHTHIYKNLNTILQLVSHECENFSTWRNNMVLGSLRTSCWR